MNIDIQDIKVKIKILKGAGKTLAQASITLFDCWTEHGWRIMTSEHLDPILQEYIWIQSPCFKAGFSWKEMVFIEPKEQYEKVYEKIYDAYRIAKYKEPQEDEAEKIFTDSKTNEPPF
ncbi:hypothetical protein A3K29_00810 [Candidatus Collierbacteria bacterium RIFOXYB2_FULL_46_14]|uniref:Uncharacterized protein n=1 Tax=Candidatus Collierbacteria bacterium GW2011_GWA2_46_26 TaxID=1618381 RepID=A0A0G1PKQ2_9BACT|nr:MAG: hypothetical protein UW29_C0008G0059 [Candidatus Collierbacteria bacterium GW2011_GWC2_44_13]KKU33257.1 MAG: hypothetical protein UX47_C0005G0059 [Candidatus Collierbacteria bacterium GW2011_GWA2_46_26]OGD72678.1 MAG: hypothetical protein A3K29_00810 [Candidatus Collierbacteria bacterium RIFOXYB2_FULL_46_14]OGD75720.1 MAG: hypothetical protein A3K43_00810 [Candidatus Collierbacteria bacterium RIFOXYA2_FULL_46_20]OGD77056.1 MAG: hypothetical protein A3K39_00810 [Candidatus Collierbacteri